MTSFLSRLDQATISEDITVALLFETYLLKRNDSGYNFITTNDEDENNNIVIEYDKNDYRFIVRSKKVFEVFKFLGIPYRRVEGTIHQVCARMHVERENENKLILIVFGHEEYDNLKKYVEFFISKYTDVTINMTLEHPKTEFYVPELKVLGFWKLFSNLFFTVKNNVDEPITY